MKLFGLFRSNRKTAKAENLPRFGATDPELCDHEWKEREQWHQKFKAEGKVVWICRRCHSIQDTYSWQKPR